MVKLLLQRYKAVIDVNVKAQGKTALVLAAENGRVEVIRQLLAFHREGFPGKLRRTLEGVSEERRDRAYRTCFKAGFGMYNLFLEDARPLVFVCVGTLLGAFVANINLSAIHHSEIAMLLFAVPAALCMSLLLGAFLCFRQSVVQGGQSSPGLANWFCGVIVAAPLTFALFCGMYDIYAVLVKGGGEAFTSLYHTLGASFLITLGSLFCVALLWVAMTGRDPEPVQAEPAAVAALASVVPVVAAAAAAPSHPGEVQRADPGFTQELAEHSAAAALR